MPSFYLCVDCGGSKTSAVIADTDGNIVGRALGGPSNFAYLGIDVFLSSVSIAVSNALKSATSPPSIEPVSLPPPEGITFAKAWFGVSGVDSPAAAAAIAPHLSKLTGIPEGPKLVVANDTNLLAAPVRLHADIHHAIAVIAGTGSIGVSYDLTPSGELVEYGRVGGWGWMLGDEGGGVSVGREAIRQVLQAWEVATLDQRDVDSVLARNLLKLYKIDSVPDILALIHRPDPPAGATIPRDLDIPDTAPPHLTQVREKRLSSLSPMVFSAAFEHGDPLALNVLQTVTEQLAAQVSALLTVKEKPVPRRVIASEAVLSLGGSLALIESYRALILKALESRGHVFKYVELVDDAAAVGAKGLAIEGKA
jgi:N-acetylglucosamine kinase-like BadF-type ATPase